MICIQKNQFKFDHHAQFSLELFDKSVNNWDFLKIQFQFFFFENATQILPPSFTCLVIFP